MPAIEPLRRAAGPALLAPVFLYCAVALASPPAMPPGCAQALDALEAAREARSAAPQVERLRQRATQACLGAEASTPPPPVRPVPPPVQVAPIAPAPPRPAPVPAPPSPLPGAVRIDRPSIVTNCDAGGCWDSEGRRLNRVGQELLGPRGPCSAQGGGYVCP